MNLNPVPFSLFHSQRAQCPDCGAPLHLTHGGPTAVCHYCGTTSGIERRMRLVEPLPSADFITIDAPIGMAGQIRLSHAIAGIAQDESHCPTCGVQLDATSDQAIVSCRHCGTESKVERRLVRRPGADADLVSLQREAAKSGHANFGSTEAILQRIINGTDLNDRVRAAHEFTETWHHFNVAALQALPALLEVLRQSDPRLEIPLADYVGKLLCDGDPRLARVAMRAAERVTFDENGSRALLWQLGLGSGICLKLLLDSADYAANRGANEYACAALWSANMIFERNFAHRVTLAEIVLYRLLYLRGPVQAWALELVKGQLGLGIRFATPVLTEFLEDCAVEMPELIPHIQQSFYPAPSEPVRPRHAQSTPDLDARQAKVDRMFFEGSDAWRLGITSAVAQMKQRQHTAREFWKELKH